MSEKTPLGACTWLFGDMTLTEIAGRLRGLGFDGVELMGDLDTTRAAEASQVVLDHGLAVLSVTPADWYGGRWSISPTPIRRSVPNRLGTTAGCWSSPPSSNQRQQSTGIRPVVGCHGHVGRIRAIGTQAEERAVFVEAVRQVGRAGPADGTASRSGGAKPVRGAPQLHGRRDGAVRGRRRLGHRGHPARRLPHEHRRGRSRRRHPAGGRPLVAVSRGRLQSRRESATVTPTFRRRSRPWRRCATPDRSSWSAPRRAPIPSRAIKDAEIR